MNVQRAHSADIRNAMKKQNVRTLVLIGLTSMYLIVGAVVFQSIELDTEIEENAALAGEKRYLMTKFNISDDEYKMIADNVLRLIPHKAGVQWSFTGSFYFVLTVITTIGYGHSTPKTNSGKAFCMVYAFCGIPLNLVMFQSIGERLNMLITKLLLTIKRCFGCKSNDVSQALLILITMNLTGIVLVGGAWVFTTFEPEWSYIDSLYYCIITMTTIGFGDFVALQNKDDFKLRPDYVAFSMFFILFGLTVLSAGMNLFILRFLTMNTDDERRDEKLAALRKSDFQLDSAAAACADGRRFMSRAIGKTAVNESDSIASSLHRVVTDATVSGRDRVFPGHLSLQFYDDFRAYSDQCRQGSLASSSADQHNHHLRRWPPSSTSLGHSLETDSEFMTNDDPGGISGSKCFACFMSTSSCDFEVRQKHRRHQIDKEVHNGASGRGNSSAVIGARHRRQRYRVTRPPATFVTHLLNQHQQQDKHVFDDKPLPPPSLRSADKLMTCSYIAGIADEQFDHDDSSAHCQHFDRSFGARSNGPSMNKRDRPTTLMLQSTNSSKECRQNHLKPTQHDLRLSPCRSYRSTNQSLDNPLTKKGEPSGEWRRSMSF